MKSPSHGRFTSAISNPFRSTLNLIFVISLTIPAALTFGSSGTLTRGFLIWPDNRAGAAAGIGISAQPVVLLGTDPLPQTLPYAQDFSTLAHSSTIYPPGWQGWQIGTGGSAGSSGAFKTIEPTGDAALTANASASSTAGAVHNYNGKIGTLSTGSLDPSIVLAVNAEGYNDIVIGFDVMTIRNPYNGSTNTRINEVDIQYRICSSVPCTGPFVSAGGVPGIYQNNTTVQTSGTAPQNPQPKIITLPAALNSESNVQLRWVQRDVSGTGSRPSFAIDNVSIAGTAECNAPAITLEPTDQAATYGEASVSFTANASGDPAASVHWEADTGSGFMTLTNGGGVSGADTTMLTISNPTVAMSGYTYRAVFGNECGGTQTATSTGAMLTVDPLMIVVTPDPGQTKTYGEADPGLTYGFSPPLIGGDALGGDLSRAAGETIGTYDITLGTLSANSNYALSLTLGVAFEVLPRSLVASIIANDRIYDGTNEATFSCFLDGIVGSDDVVCTGGTGAFVSQNAGVNLVTAAGLAIGGTDAGNYTLPVTAAADEAEISVRPITVTAVSDARVYDGTTGSSGIPFVSTGSIVAGDTGAFTQTFDTKHAGTGKTLTPTGSVSDGNGGTNYAITFVVDPNGVISQRPVTVTAVATAKVFDGNTSSSGVPTVVPGLIGSDTPGFFQTYDTPAAGTGKTLTPFGIANDDNGGANYSYTFDPVDTGVITASYCFEGFHSPIGGSVEGGNGGSYTDPVRSFKLNSTIPIKFTLFAGNCSGSPIVTGVHTLQMIKYANAVDSEPAIDATPTDAATTGNQFRLTGTDWHYNLDTKRTPGISAGIWLVKVTLLDGSVKTVWISIKK